MNRNIWIGTVCGILSAVSFGLNPLFALPLYQHGMTTSNVLFYRFLFAVILMGGLLTVRRKSFRLERKQLLPSVFSGILLAFTCLLVFLSYRILDAGIGSTILFVYPIMVALIMGIFFHEKLKPVTWLGMFSCLAGIVLLYQPAGSGKFSVLGVVYVLLSALVYALYMVNIRESSLRDLPSETMTFYAMLFGLPIFLLCLRGGADLRLPPDLLSWGCIIGLACCPALLSFVTLAVSIHYIGPTMTAVLGVFEPLTAVLVNVFVFGGELSPRQIVGIAVILAAVTFALSGKKDAGKPADGPKSAG